MNVKKKNPKMSFAIVNRMQLHEDLLLLGYAKIAGEKNVRNG